MFLFDLLVYVLFAWVMFTFARKSNELYGEDDHLDEYLWGYMLFFAVISAIRWRVGVDCNSYIKTFQTGVWRQDSKEVIWSSFVNFIKYMDFHFTIGTGLIAFVQIFFLTEALKKYKYILIWLPVVIFGGRYFLDMMNGVRQMTVACGFVYISSFIYQRNIIKYIVGIILLSGIHTSAVILLPLYFVTYIPFEQLRLTDRRIIWASVLLACFIIGQTPQFQELTKYLEPILQTTGYEDKSEYYKKLLSGNTSEQLSFGPIMLSYLMISIAVIWFGPMLSYRFGQEIKSFNLWYFFAILYSCFYFLFCNAGHMMIRPLQYFELFQAVILSVLLFCFWCYKEIYKKYLYALICIIWICTSIGVYKASGQKNESVIYKTYFGHL